MIPSFNPWDDRIAKCPPLVVLKTFWRLLKTETDTPIDWSSLARQRACFCVPPNGVSMFERIITTPIGPPPFSLCNLSPSIYLCPGIQHQETPKVAADVLIVALIRADQPFNRLPVYLIGEITVGGEETLTHMAS